MKQIKLQEQFFGKDKEFRTTKILKKHPELLDGKPVKFEVVSPDYIDYDFDMFYFHFCRNCPNRLEDNYDKHSDYYEVCTLTKQIIHRNDGWDPYSITDECTLFEHTKGKKLGTMKLELAIVGKYFDIEDGGITISISSNNVWIDNHYIAMSKQDCDFIKDNEYFKKNDLVVVLKVSEVVRYE